MGSSSYVTDSNGRPVAYYDYLPFGEVAVEHNQTTNFNNGYKFNAKELDEATGMSYYGARYYDPRISVFVSVDPLVDATMMPYQYCSNNPVNRIDPTGMADHDYRLNSDGTIDLIKTTNENYHTIYNENFSESIIIPSDNFIGNVDNKLESIAFSIYDHFMNNTFQVYHLNCPDISEMLYRFMADNSSVEIGKFDGYFGNKYSGFVFTENKPTRVSNVSFAKRLSRMKYSAIRFSHSHPKGEQYPSGYHGIESLEGLYLYPNEKIKNRGDRYNSKFINSINGFEETVHEVYSPIHKTFTRYYGDERANDPTYESYID